MANLTSNLGQIGPKIEQIWDFLRSVSVHFGSQIVIFFKKIANGNFFEKNVDLAFLKKSFWQFFDIEMAIFRRFSCALRCDFSIEKRSVSHFT